MEALGAYNGEDIVLELPGNLTIFDIDWLSIYDMALQENFGSVTIPSQLSVPPALVSIVVSGHFDLRDFVVYVRGLAISQYPHN